MHGIEVIEAWNRLTRLKVPKLYMEYNQQK